MPYYSFNIKKGKYQIEMTSDDIYFANRQIDKLLEKLLKSQGKLRVVLPPIDSTKIEKEAQELEKIKNIKEISPIISKTQEKQQIEPVEKIEVTIPKSTIETKEIVEISEKKPFQDNEKIQEEFTTEVDEKSFEIIEETKEKKEIIEEPEENLFENILAEKTQEIEQEETEEQDEKETNAEKKPFSFKNIVSEKLKSSNSNENAIRQKSGFKSHKEEPIVNQIETQNTLSNNDEDIAKILEEKIKKNLPPAENKTILIDEAEQNNKELENDSDFSMQNFESLGELIAVKNPQSKLDYLLLTTYYLQTKENLFKYSLKQINSKLMPFLGSLIDHSIIHNGVALDFIEVVPDYNGASEVTEYRLTKEGENHLLS